MSRPTQIDSHTKSLLPIVCRVFSELGYRRTTTAELARRCDVRENILYRLWPDKKAMFLAAIHDVFQSRTEMWSEVLADQPDPELALERIVNYEATHQGEFGFYRIVFTALTESDDEEIRAALVGMYRSFHQFVLRHVAAARKSSDQLSSLPVESVAWGLLGLATISNIIRELKLLPPRQRERTFLTVAKQLLRGGMP